MREVVRLRYNFRFVLLRFQDLKIRDEEDESKITQPDLLFSIKIIELSTTS